MTNNLKLTLLGNVFSLGLALFSGTSNSQPVTSDLSVMLSASPTENVAVGQPIEVTLSVSNHGSEAVPVVVVDTSPFHRQLSLLQVNVSECFLDTIVLDYPGGVDYVLSWIVAAYGGLGDPLQPGETRACHFQIALNDSAQPTYTLTFSLVSNVDDQPGNDSASVEFHLGAHEPLSVPTLSQTMLLVLGIFLCVAGAVTIRK